ncbi:carboxymuconolactone decarboxylase family protein [Pseudochelatococcus sp. B33]
MARIPFPDEGVMTPEQRKVFDAVVAGPRGALIGPLRAALHRPDLAEVWQQFGAMLRYGTSLPLRLSELAILVTARRWNSQLEWHVHSATALKAGLDPDVIRALSVGETPEFGEEDQAAIYEFARELQMTGEVKEKTYALVRDRWGPLGVVELTTLIGYYTLVSMTLNAHHIPLPDGAEAPLRPCHPPGQQSDFDVTLTDIAASTLRPSMEKRT